MLLIELKRFQEAKALFRKVVPVARRVSGEGDENTRRLRMIYAQVLYYDPDATPDDVREAVTALEDVERIARRVFGGAHPLVKSIELELRISRAKLRAHETPSS